MSFSRASTKVTTSAISQSRLCVREHESGHEHAAVFIVEPAGDFDLFHIGAGRQFHTEQAVHGLAFRDRSR